MSAVSRRRALAVTGCAVLTLPWVAAGCGKSVPKSCLSGPEVTDAVEKAREALGYQDIAKDETRHCEACRQWVEATESGQCGGCKVLGGPVHPHGTCNAFAAT